MVTTPSSRTQHILVVQFILVKMQNLALMEPVTLSTTQQKVWVVQCTLSPHQTLSVLGLGKFINNSALHGGVICTQGSLTFSGTIYFTSNKVRIGEVDGMSDARGGGMFMGVKSTLSILPKTTVYWETNHATLGGAIYVRDAIAP